MWKPEQMDNDASFQSVFQLVRFWHIQSFHAIMLRCNQSLRAHRLPFVPCLISNQLTHSVIHPQTRNGFFDVWQGFNFNFNASFRHTRFSFWHYVDLSVSLSVCPKSTFLSSRRRVGSLASFYAMVLKGPVWYKRNYLYLTRVHDSIEWSPISQYIKSYIHSSPYPLKARRTIKNLRGLRRTSEGLSVLKT